MAYERHNWVCGETVTADKMNNLEDGIEEAMSSGGTTAPLILNISNDTLDRTFAEIRDAYLGGRSVLLDPFTPTKSWNSMVKLLVSDRNNIDTSGGNIYFWDDTGGYVTYYASSASDYPTYVSPQE